LWSFDDNNEPVLELAAEVPSLENGGLSEDGTTITIKLRDDVAWSDGTPLTSDDFVFTYEMIMSDSNVVQSRYPYEDYVTSVDGNRRDTTVTVTFSEPFAPWLTSIFTYVLPRARAPAGLRRGGHDR
jgi:peptide/nickel transport system substrate-binding protein